MSQSTPPTILFILTSMSRLCVSASPHTIIWDIQTGIIIRDISTWDIGKIVFSKDQATITLVTDLNFYMYDLCGELVCEGELLPSLDHKLAAHWVDDKYPLFAIDFRAKGDLVISVQELQPSSDPPLVVVKSFSMPPQDGSCCFSPVSSHASFVYDGRVVILNAQDSEVLLQTEPTQGPYFRPSFSPDGHFFACQTSSNGVDIWENTSAGYVFWGTLRARSPWHKLSWSPASVSVLCWDSSGIQLLHLDNSLDTVLPKEAHNPRGHLVTFTTDQAHIVTAKKYGRTITVLNHSDATQLSIDTNVLLSDIKIVGDTIFVTDGKRLFSWQFTTGGQVNSTSGIRRQNKVLCLHAVGFLVLSNDCSKIAFSAQETVFLYDVESQKVVGNLVTDGKHISHMQFSPNGCQLWFIVWNGQNDSNCYCVDLERAEKPCFSNVTIVHLEVGWSLDALFQSPHEYHITGNECEWVSDSRGNLLWLPPNWRSKHGLQAKWNGNFLTFVGGQHPEPIIIEFQS